MTPPPAAPTTRTPTPVNPTAQTRPAPTAAPTTARPTSAATPDFTKAKPLAPQIAPSLKDGIKALYGKGTPPPALAVATQPVATPPPAPAAAPPPVETPPVATTPPAPELVDRFSDIKEPEGISEAGQKGWKALKTKAETEIKTAEKKLADAEAQLNLLRKATPAEVADVERLKTEHKNALDRLAVLDLQNHPDFTRQFVEPKAKALAEASEVLGYNGKAALDPSILGKSQKDFNAAVAEMTKDMNSMDATTVQTAMRQAYKLSGDERAALAKASELRSGMAEKEALQTKQAFEKVYGNLGFENLISPKEAPADATPEGKAEVAAYNQALAQTRTIAEKNAFGRLSPDEAATVATKAAYLDIMVQHVVPVLEKGYAAVVAERNALAEELQAIRGLKQPGSFTAPAETDTGEKKDAKYYLRRAFPKG